MCFIAIVRPLFTQWLDYGLFRLPDQDYRLTAGVTGQHGMLTPPRHLIPLLVCPGVRDYPTLVFVFYLGLTRLITVRYLCLYISLGNTVNVFNFVGKKFRCFCNLHDFVWINFRWIWLGSFRVVAMTSLLGRTDGQTDGVTRLLDLLSPLATQVKNALDNILLYLTN